MRLLFLAAISYRQIQGQLLLDACVQFSGFAERSLAELFDTKGVLVILPDVIVDLFVHLRIMFSGAMLESI